MSDETFVPNVIGEGLFKTPRCPKSRHRNPSETEELDETLLHPESHYRKPIRIKELRQIQADIQGTTRPCWQRAPPSNLGEPSHGKLKADQWRTLIEFDIPASLVKLWCGLREDDGDADNAQRRKLMDSTMLLATAIQWVTSCQTSANHVMQYTRNMHAYLQSLCDLDADCNLLPNHHNVCWLERCF
jgi:hypothetical protein